MIILTNDASREVDLGRLAERRLESADDVLAGWPRQSDVVLPTRDDLAGGICVGLVATVAVIGWPSENSAFSGGEPYPRE